MRQTYLIHTGRQKHQAVGVACGAPNCFTRMDVNEAFKIKIPMGAGMASFDARPKTPTGGRLGAPSQGRRRFLRTETVWGCVRCALRYPIAAYPARDARFQERCKSGRR